MASGSSSKMMTSPSPTSQDTTQHLQTNLPRIILVNNTVGISEDSMEELLNKKIEQIRLRNEETMKKHQMKEEDRKMAEQSGRSVTLQLSSSAKKLQAVESEGKVSTTVDGDSNLIKADKKSSQLHGQTDAHHSEARPRYQKPKVMSPTSKDVPKSPPPDPSFNFLADRTRDGCVSQETSPAKAISCRHRRNFGGNSFENAAHKVQLNREQKHGQPLPSGPQSKIEYQLATTGKERLDYAKWKSEQEKIDRDRVLRHKNAKGEWRREWDRDKVQFETEERTVSSVAVNQQIEPTRRPYGRIGSGRFIGGEGQVIPLKEHRNVMKDSRSSPNKRPPKSSLASADVEPRHVKACNESLIVKIANDSMVAEVDRCPVKNGKDASRLGGKSGNGSVRKDRQQSKLVGSGRLSVVYDSDSDTEQPVQNSKQRHAVVDGEREGGVRLRYDSGRSDRGQNVNHTNRLGQRGGGTNVDGRGKSSHSTNVVSRQRDLNGCDASERKKKHNFAFESTERSADNDTTNVRAVRSKSRRKPQCRRQPFVDTPSSVNQCDLIVKCPDQSAQGSQIVAEEVNNIEVQVSLKADLQFRGVIKSVEELDGTKKDETQMSMGNIDANNQIMPIIEEALLCESNIDLNKSADTEINEQLSDEDQWEDVEGDNDVETDVEDGVEDPGVGVDVDDEDEEFADNFEDSMCDVDEECCKTIKEHADSFGR